MIEGQEVVERRVEVHRFTFLSYSFQPSRTFSPIGGNQ